MDEFIRLGVVPGVGQGGGGRPWGRIGLRSVAEITKVNQEVDAGLEAILKLLPPNDWETKQVISFDWYDGPTMGLCELARPRSCFSFDILGQRFDAQTADRLYRLSEASPDAVDRVIEALADLGPCVSPEWTPVWRFTSEDTEREARRSIDFILASLRPTPIILRAINMRRFLQYWLDVTGLYDVK